MARSVTVVAVLALMTGFGAGSAGKVTNDVGPAGIVAPGFGYTVAYRDVWHGGTADTTVALFVYDHGRWRNATPPQLHSRGIDDVVFTDRRHGWVAANDCIRGGASVYLYRTSDGGRSWRSLGAHGTHSCGGGPTYLSFVDARNGWMEPVSPNGPGGELLRTRDGGASWSLV